MKLVYIYGPPGVGKLSTAKELSKITDCRLFHNNLTSDVAASIFEHGSKPYEELVVKLRFEIIERAAKEGIDMVFTNVYANSSDKYIKKLIKLVEKYEGKVCFVRLYCNINQLYERLKNPSRKSFGKINNVNTLNKVLKKYQLFSPIPYVENLSINNTNIPPKEAAKIIKFYYKL